MYDTHKHLIEFLTGVLIGIAGIILFTISVWAVEPMKLGQTVSEELEIYPYQQQIDEAQEYLTTYKIVIPETVEKYCIKYGEEYGICPELLEAICWTESNCKENVSSSDGSCKGLMQIKPSSHRKRMSRLGVNNIYDIESNIKVGADYLAELACEDSNINIILARYNGVADVESVRDNPTDYIKKVLKIAQSLERVHFK